MSWPWESKVSILPILVFPTIFDMRFWLSPALSEIFSWVHPRRAGRMMVLVLKCFEIVLIHSQNPSAVQEDFLILTVSD